MHPDAHGPSRGRTVVLIEGDAAVRDALGAALESAGYKVVAMRLAERFRDSAPESTACVVLDLDLPGPGVTDLLTRLQRHRPTLPVVPMSGRMRRRATLHLGGRAVLVLNKPFGADELIAAVEGAAQR